MSECLKAE